MTDAPSNHARMSAERWNVLEPLLDAALDQPATARRAFLAGICGPDHGLLAELLQLLHESDQPDAELDAGVGALAPALLATVAPRALDIPDVLADRYRIVRELGQGGMSVVFLADDLRLGRQVAIKVLRREVRLRNGGDRFVAEIRLTANLRHRNIVPLFESGDAAGWTFFVMPHIDGETLMQRLARSGAFESAHAIRIVTDIASALSHAHAAGIVHRDVKPSNIMLAEGQALLMDFGIARATSEAGPHFTLTGVTVGTPAYMSPEQCIGAAPAGPASDIYSLGGVLYEMLAGQPPIAAAKRIFDAAAGITARAMNRDIAAVIPPALLAVVDRAMQLDPAHRYASADHFAAALSSALSATAVSDGAPPPTVPAADFAVAADGAGARTRSGARGWIESAGIVVFAVAGFAVAAQYKPTSERANPRLGADVRAVRGDTSRILLLPVEYDPAITARLSSHDALRDALTRWAGVTLVDAAQTREALATQRGASRDSSRELTAAAASALATRTGAGRYLRRDLTLRGTQTYLHAGLYETGSDSLLNDGTVNLGAGLDTSDVGYRELAAQILLAGVPSGLRSGSHVGTQSRPALQQFARGVSAVDRWDLVLADSALDLAARYDSAFARSELWLAQVRVWRQRPADTWTYLVNRADARRSTLGVRDQRALDALSAQSRGDTRAGCALWERLAVTEATDFAAWYGAASCESVDDAIVRDGRSVSGWRFRSSYQHATTMFRRAFQILPAVHREFRATWFAGLDGVLFTSPSQLRFGVAARPDSGVFAAYPSWDGSGDSLAFVPYRLQDVEAGLPATYPRSHRDAIQHQRELMLRIGTTWRAAFPASADALLSVAVALDKLSDPRAVDSLGVAQTLAATPDERLRIGIARVWMQVKYALPGDPTALRSARALADSLLRTNAVVPPAAAEAMASVAVLSGHPMWAVHYAQIAPGSVDKAVSAQVIAVATALQILAASGAPADSLQRLEAVADALIARSSVSTEQNGVRERFIGRAATLSFPAYRSPLLAVLAQSGDALAAAQSHWSRGDTAATRRALEKMATDRRALPAEYLKLETLLPEAVLFSALGDTGQALARLAPTLDAVTSVDLEAFRSPVGAAMLVRAVAMRAELAARLGDRVGVARWALAFLALWGDAEPMLRPQVRRVSALVG